MKKDAEVNADEDKRQFELVSARNEGDSMCYQMEKTIADNEDKLQDSDKEPLQAAIEKVREAGKGEDVDAIKSAVKELEQASHAVSEVLYKASTSGEGEGGEGAEEASADSTPDAADDAIDAEFEVKND